MKDNNSIADEVGNSRDKVTEVGAEEALEVIEIGEYESADETADYGADGVAPVSQIIIPQISIFPCCLGLLNFAKPIFIPLTVVQDEIE